MTSNVTIKDGDQVVVIADKSDKYIGRTGKVIIARYMTPGYAIVEFNNNPDERAAIAYGDLRQVSDQVEAFKEGQLVVVLRGETPFLVGRTGRIAYLALSDERFVLVQMDAGEYFGIKREYLASVPERPSLREHDIEHHYTDLGRGYSLQTSYYPAGRDEMMLAKVIYNGTGEVVAATDGLIASRWLWFHVETWAQEVVNGTDTRPWRLYYSDVVNGSSLTKGGVR